MKLRSSIRLGMTTVVLSGLILSLGVVAFRAKADVWDKKTVVTIDQPIQVEDTYLEPGSYVFKLLNSDSSRHIVQIFNRDQNHLINTIMAIPNYRVAPTDGSRFMFYETPPGTANAVRAWFYPGDNFGQEFRYPKELRQLAVAIAPATVSRPLELQPDPPSESSITKPVEPETPLPAPAQAVNEPPQQEEPAVVAQNNPPAQAEPAPSPELSKPAELPKTATPFPLMGLFGFVSLIAYSLLRLKTMA